MPNDTPTRRNAEPLPIHEAHVHELVDVDELYRPAGSDTACWLPRVDREFWREVIDTDPQIFVNACELARHLLDANENQVDEILERATL